MASCHGPAPRLGDSQGAGQFSPPATLAAPGFTLTSSVHLGRPREGQSRRARGRAAACAAVSPLVSARSGPCAPSRCNRRRQGPSCQGNGSLTAHAIHVWATTDVWMPTLAHTRTQSHTRSHTVTHPHTHTHTHSNTLTPTYAHSHTCTHSHTPHSHTHKDIIHTLPGRFSDVTSGYPSLNLGLHPHRAMPPDPFPCLQCQCDARSPLGPPVDI